MAQIRNSHILSQPQKPSELSVILPTDSPTGNHSNKNKQNNTAISAYVLSMITRWSGLFCFLELRISIKAAERVVNFK